MANTDYYDAIILGSGQAGNPLASALAKAGRKTALIESRYVGGTCINYGCTPTKTMVASARMAYLARRSGDYGVADGDVRVNMEQVRERKRKIVASFREGSEQRLTSMDNLDLIYGQARFTPNKTVHVALNEGGERTLAGENIFINTGGRSSIPDIEGIEGIPVLDNESIMELDVLPEHLLVLGGGYIGVEFAQMFHRFGSRVSIIQEGKQLLDHEDADIAGEVKKIFEEDGMEVLLNAKAIRASRTGESIQLQLDTPGGRRTVSGSHLLLATGRVPNTKALDLDVAGIETDERGYIGVNERLETNVAGIYALGDVKGGPAFTHISYDDYRIVSANLLEGKQRSTTGRMVPYTIYMDPQLGRIGMTEEEARRLGKKIRVARMPMTSVARAIETSETRGMMKIVVDADSERILGAAVLGIEGGEVAAMVQIAMMGDMPFSALRDAVFAHPTLAESLNNVFFSWQEDV